MGVKEILVEDLNKTNPAYAGDTWWAFVNLVTNVLLP